MSEPEVGAETSADLSLHDELTAAFDAETPGEDSGTTVSAAQGAPSSPPVSGEQNAAGSPLEAPKHWAEADRSLFSKAPREIQQRWIARESEIQKGFDAKSQEFAGFKREREQLGELFSPYERDLELRGMSRTQFVGSLLGAHKFLQDSPREALLWLAGEYGVDPKTLIESQEVADPRFAALTKELTTVKSQFQGLVTESQTREHAEKVSRVESFAGAKGDDGKPLHPYFDECSDDILRLMKATPGMDLETAYNKAIRMNDEVWEKLQADKTLATSKNRDRQRIAEVDKAKRAAIGHESSSVTGSAKPKSLAEELEVGFANWSGH